ncbi:MAG TPA: hypothetical protein VMF61_09570 [Candidatus Acidoferrales bacterium]|nr:hypothetical protein [Candidatus Acidoferrales bacterium]
MKRCRQLAGAYPEFRQAGAEPVLPQSVENAKPYRDRHPVPFHVLVEKNMTVSGAFGVAYTMPEYFAILYKTVF